MVWLIPILAVLVLAELYALALQCRNGHTGWKELSLFRYAHRGYHEKPHIPENSMAAFRRALQNYYGVELDVHLMADGNLAVIHDSSLKRTAGADVEIEDLTLADLENYRLEGTDERIPLLRQVLAATGGFEKAAGSLHTLAAPQTPAGQALGRKFGFGPGGEDAPWQRRRRPDLTAVEFTHQNLARWLAPGGFYIDATCGNGGDTEFLCRLAGEKGRVLALDIQQQAVDNTNTRLARLGLGGIGKAVRADHAELAAPQSADCVLFNFGYLPGADHSLFTTPASSLPAVQAALEILKPGGVLAACLYSGGPNGSAEKQAVREYLEQLPLAQYTTLVCSFANWAETAPLPCFVFKR